MKVGIFIGRFQPIHKGHISLITHMSKEVDSIILLLGSAPTSISLRNPFTVKERIDMINLSLRDIEIPIKILTIKDYFYVENGWLKEVQRLIKENTNKKDQIFLYGHFKDSTSSYLNWFPQWELKSLPKFRVCSDATIVRELLYTDTIFDYDKYKSYITKDVYDYIKDVFINTQRHINFISEYDYIKEYKKGWKYPPTFVTTDTVVTQAGHVLLVKRGRNPGIGKYALPGGFLSQDESIIDSALRELKEETTIDINKDILKKCIKSNFVFDYPWRSSRGRTITHAYHIQLDDNRDLPIIKADDDAAEAMWMPLGEIESHIEDFFEDHFHIIEYFTK